MSDEPAATLLLQLRLQAFARSDRLAALLGVAVEQIDQDMDRLAERGWVQHRDGMAPGWSLTPDGRRHGQQLLRSRGRCIGCPCCHRGLLPTVPAAQRRAAAGLHGLADGRRRRRARAQRPRRPDRDAAVLARLDVLHSSAVPVLGDLGEASGRFATYGERLERAHRHVRDGRTEWIAKPTVDSYHGVWFELHEHLLVTLDRDRSTEPLPQYAPIHDGESNESQPRSGGHRDGHSVR